MLRHTIEFRDKTADKILTSLIFRGFEKVHAEKVEFGFERSQVRQTRRLIASQSLGQIDPKGIVQHIRSGLGLLDSTTVSLSS